MACKRPELVGIDYLDALGAVFLTHNTVRAFRHVGPDLHFLRIGGYGAEITLVGCHKVRSIKVALKHFGRSEEFL